MWGKRNLAATIANELWIAGNRVENCIRILELHGQLSDAAQLAKTFHHLKTLEEYWDRRRPR